ALAALLGPLPDPEVQDLWDADRDEALFARITGDPAPREVLTHAPQQQRRPGGRSDGVRPQATARTARYGSRILAVLATCAVLVVGLWWGQDHQVASAAGPTMLSYAEASPDDVLAGDAPSASDALTALAAAAAARTDPPRAGDVQYIEHFGWWLEESTTTSDVYPTHLRMWLAPDGTTTTHSVRDLAIEDLSSLEGKIPDGTTQHDELTEVLPQVVADPNLPAHLPRDPAALRQAVVAEYGASNCTGTERLAACLVSYAASLHTQYVVPADLDAALWQMLAEEPGVRLLGGVTDRAGRAGVAIGYRQREIGLTFVNVLIISPANGSVLGSEDVTYEPEKPGELMALDLLLTSEWTTQTGP
ncbi:MAG: hypothetical protein HGA44_19815, partial [Cellulomonadaceae bacterium]|nr:hypothetical protein [Cellulomonadaceae bacterium]